MSQRRSNDWTAQAYSAGRLHPISVIIGADFSAVSDNVRFWGQSGHDATLMRCLLLTQSGHSAGKPSTPQWATSGKLV